MEKKYIDDLIEFDNKLLEVMDKKHKVLGYFRKKMYKNMRVGFEILEEDGSVAEQYTIVVKDKPFIDSYEEGLNDVRFIKSVKKSVLEEFMVDKEKYFDRPLYETSKWFPKSFKMLYKGDVKLKIRRKR